MAQKILILVNDAPYGTEKAYNALRLAMQPGKDHSEGAEMSTVAEPATLIKSIYRNISYTSTHFRMSRNHCDQVPVPSQPFQQGRPD